MRDTLPIDCYLDCLERTSPREVEDMVGEPHMEVMMKRSRPTTARELLLYTMQEKQRVGTLLMMLAALSMVLFAGCESESPVGPERGVLNIQGLEDLGPNFVYEGWVIVNGAPVSTGRFTVDSSGQSSAKGVTVRSSDLDSATAFVLTIEPVPGQQPRAERCSHSRRRLRGQHGSPYRRSSGSVRG